MVDFFLCRRRSREIVSEEPQIVKRPKLFKGDFLFRDSSSLFPLPEEPQKAYHALISEREESSPSQLLTKVQLLRTVMERVEAVLGRCSHEDPGQPSPVDRSSSLLNEIEARELAIALQADPYNTFGFSGISLKDATTIQAFTNDEAVNAYAAIITRDTDLPVATSYLYELLRDMYSTQRYDVDKVEALLNQAGISGNAERLGIPIAGKHWRFAVVSQATETIQLYSVSKEKQEEVFALLQWFAHNQFLDKPQFSESSEALPESSPRDSGPLLLYTLRCLALHSPFKWRPEDSIEFKQLLLLELKRNTLLPSS